MEALTFCYLVTIRAGRRLKMLCIGKTYPNPNQVVAQIKQMAFTGRRK